ncbi:YeeE/YedE family protein [Vibrio sp. IRLE0018]|uniref:YeeE/YedE family protein n=1 Tax=Vibrio TaxID=662 RepID=UPI001592C98E|nr:MULTISPECIES: YeeE/YedE family protein [Vibrio]MCF8777928.1 YeeE/YedE family protein [Vibrio floridensis]NVC64202.1 YeeE/YedE family protein [Vibrio sp. 05-20-BW147]HAS6347085.1 YeeE/YedE family protein [Vibrio vulnificus]
MEFAVPWTSLAGGILLGISALTLMLLNGKVAGISGILTGLLTPKTKDFAWRLMFVIGMISGGVLAATLSNTQVSPVIEVSSALIIVAGLLVGIGTRLGNGCTSGHGICGIGRLSKRSIVATCIFMAVAAITVFIRLHLI